MANPFATLASMSWLLAQQTIDPSNLQRVPGTYFAGHFSQVMLIAVVLGAVAYWLLQRGAIKDRVWTIAGFAAFGLAVMFAFGSVSSESNVPGDGTGQAEFASVIRFCFSVLAIAGGLGFLVAREPVHAALGFATAVLSSCGILFMQQAYFIAAATVIVYAGATIIIFLFVLMFAHQTHLRAYDVVLTRPALAAVIATSLVITITYSVAGEGEILPLKIDTSRQNSLAAQPKGPGEDPPILARGMTTEQLAEFVPSKTSALGRAMYTDYLMAIELAGTVLLVATIGAIALAQKPAEDAS